MLAFLFWLGLWSGEKLISRLGYLNDGVSSSFLPIGTWRLWVMEMIDFHRQNLPAGWRSRQVLASGCLHRDKENQSRLCRCRDTSGAVTTRTFRPGANIGISTEVPDGYKNLALDPDLDRVARRTLSPIRFWDNSSGVSGRCCVGEAMYLACRRDLSTPFFVCFFLVPCKLNVPCRYPA